MISSETVSVISTARDVSARLCMETKMPVELGLIMVPFF